MNNGEFGGDSTEDFAAARRLQQAGTRTEDQMTIDASQVRARRLGEEHGFDFTDPSVQKMLGNPDAGKSKR